MKINWPLTIKHILSIVIFLLLLLSIDIALHYFLASDYLMEHMRSRSYSPLGSVDEIEAALRARLHTFEMPFHVRAFQMILQCITFFGVSFFITKKWGLNKLIVLLIFLGVLYNFFLSIMNAFTSRMMELLFFTSLSLMLAIVMSFLGYNAAKRIGAASGSGSSY